MKLQCMQTGAATCRPRWAFARDAFLSTVSVAAVSLATLGGWDAAQAQAVNVADGTTVDVPGPLYPSSTYVTALDNAPGYGFRSVNGSTINGTDVTIVTNGLGAVGLYVSSAAAAAYITMIGGFVTTTRTGTTASYGAFANGSGGRLALYGTSVATAGNGAHGVFNSSSPGVLLDAVTIRTTGSSAYGVYTAAAGAFSTVQNGSYVETAGTASSGVLASAGGRIDISDSTVVTYGTSAGALGATANATPTPATLNASNVTVETYGDRASGVTAFQSGSVANVVGGSIHTRGASSYGLLADSVGTINAQNATVLTEGTAAYGVRSFADAAATNPSVVNLDNVTFATTGSSGYGLYAEGRGIVNASDASIHTSGSLAHGLVAKLGGEINFSGRILTEAPDAAGIAGMTTSGQSNHINVTDALISPGGDGYLASGGTSIVNLTSSLLTAGSGLAMDFRAGTTTLTSSSTTMTGAAFTGAGAISRVTLQDSSVWNLTGTSNLTDLTNNASLIDFTPPTGDPTLLSSYKTLTTVNYIGGGGTLGLNTRLDADGSPSDRLIINGGAATGNSFLRITNAGGGGALTTGNGILVVDTINGGTTAGTAFALATPVAAGPYEYLLFRSSVDPSNPQAWYLRSTLDCTLAPNAPVCQQPPPPGPGPGPEVPDFRPETSLYAAIPSMALLYGRNLMDTLHQRVGDEEDLRNRPRGNDLASGAWGRFIGQHGTHDGDPLGVFGGGPAFSYNIGAFQGGQDLLRREGADGSRDHAGLYGAVGMLHGEVTHFDQTAAGANSLNAYSVGGYWTHFGAMGWYLDAVLQGTRYDVTSSANRGLPALATHGDGVAGSLEGGYPFRLANGYFIEPQAQLIYQRIAFNDASDTAALIKFDNVDSLAARIGARFGRTWSLDSSTVPDPRLLTVWVRPNVWHEFRGNPLTQFSSDTGFIPFRADLGGTWGEINAGISGQFKSAITLFANASYQERFDGKGFAYDGKLGARVSW